MIWANVGCGPYRADPPWINLDVADNEHVHPDVRVEDAAFPLAGYGDDTVDRVYLGHVLEHVPWHEVPSFLVDVRRAMRPGAELCAVGPDVYRIIQRWRDGLDPEGWLLVESCLENPWGRDYSEEIAYGLEYKEPDWPYARHHWNCFEARMVKALEDYGGFVDVATQPITRDALGSWPLVAYTQWQCAATARKPIHG